MSMKKNKKKIELQQFSLASSFYNEENGTLPNENSIIYENPFLERNVARYIAELSNEQLINFVCGSYFVGIDKNKIYNNLPIVIIITDPDNLFGKTYDDWVVEDLESRKDIFEYYVLENFSKNDRESERPATIEYFPSKKNTVGFSQDVGLRLKGHATRIHYKKSFRIIDNEEYCNMHSDGKGPVTKYKLFNIRNGGNDSEFSKMRDSVL
ncbi:hypothetical protein BCR32DRAFT_286347 [Anaeromyces robustus]|uniref:Uncharacterized protein n=1 Tax=Anaeromyces robustus TaxID=1754192 RepID=A0A1Y1VY72_9FUNG|nr:hypothetical protein BCR32DRAFT_286347 [Anaeromyces robustus]|eukprot:ORX66230.1 hypothetical protein BCR32DRAFT_286347 [Anaeromyces robustus]